MVLRAWRTGLLRGCQRTVGNSCSWQNLVNRHTCVGWVRLAATGRPLVGPVRPGRDGSIEGRPRSPPADRKCAQRPLNPDLVRRIAHLVPERAQAAGRCGFS